MSPKEKPLKRNNKNNPQIRSYTEAIKRGQRNIHVFQKDGEWAIKKIGASDLGNYNNKEEALNYARKLARDNNSELIIHGRDGFIQERYSYSSDPHPLAN
jgi:hypothetical protein